MSGRIRDAVKLFRELFAAHSAHIAMLNGEGVILAVNDAWRVFGEANGLAPGYRFENQDYVDVCHQASTRRAPLAEQAMVGLLGVLKAEQRSFAMLYPCHAPHEPRWFRMWAQTQQPEVDAVVVAHTYIGRDLAELNEKSQAGRPSVGGRPVLDAMGLPLPPQPQIEFPWLYLGASGFGAG